MKRLILTALFVLLTVVTPAVAQQAGDNVNVLPIVAPVDGNGAPVPDWFKHGDGYLQRQVEPTIAASTLNPDHLLAFFNDYRAVDVVEGDVGLGEGEITSVALKLAQLLLPPEIATYLPKGELVPPMNAAEAWIGGSRSYDGGITWSGFFLPGPTWDDSAVTQSAPIYGLNAATDPVLAAGPCGTFYLTFVAFTRGGESKIAVARYRDTNDLEGGDTIIYEGMTVIESGNNAEFGYFLDKPDIEVDVFRNVASKKKPRPQEPVDQCGHRVYVTYSTFNGLTKDEKVQTKMNFAVSEDGGLTFASSKINKTFNQNQGSAIAVDPRPGTPGDTGGGTVFVFWRHFFEPHAIIWTRSTNYGLTWSNPAILTDPTAMVNFDQPTISTTALIAQGYADETTEIPDTAFRSNSFPAAAIAPHSYDPGTDTWDATIFVAWQERVDIDPVSDTFGEPHPLEQELSGLVNGSPRIVMMRSPDEGQTWEGFDPLSGTGSETIERQAIDLFERDDPFDPSLNVPAPETRQAGPQVQPKLSFGGGRLMLNFYESRGKIITDLAGNEAIDSNPIKVDSSTSIPYITGYNRVMDFRATLLTPESGAWISSAQISRYPIKAGADLADGYQDLEDVAAVNPPCSPDFDLHPVYGGPGLPPCVRQVNRVNVPQSALGTAPFIGDYPDLTPVVQFVPDGNGWRWAIGPEDVPYRGFRSIWTDNRHLIPATQVDPNATYATYVDPLADPVTGANIKDWEKYQSYGPPGIGGACFNPGSRNTDVLTSRVDTELIVSAPTTFKQLDAPRSFPFSVRNTTGEFRRFLIEIATATANASLSPIDPLQDTYEVVVFPYSESSLTVYVEPPGGQDPTGNVGPIRVEVSLLASQADPDAPWVLCSECPTATLTFNSDPAGATVQNLVDDDGNPIDENFGPEVSNAFVINYKPSNAFVINDVLENGFVDNAFVINEGEENAFVINNGEENAFVINAFVINAFVINREIFEITDTVWTMAPSESNTAATYLPLINIDNAEQLEGSYAFQLIVDKPASYGGVGLASEDICSSLNKPQQQILSNVVQDPDPDPLDPDAKTAFVINDFVENAFVINSEVQNAFVINSAFTLPPSNNGGGNGAKSVKAGGIDDSATRAPLPPNEVRITLRAFQLVEDIDLPKDVLGNPIKFVPELHPPSITLFHQACNPATDPECAKVLGADLQISGIDLTPLVGEQCGSVPFPGFTLENVGTAPAIPRGGTIRHGIYLSEDSILDASDTLLTPPLDEDILSTVNPLPGKLDPERDLSDDFYEDFGTIELDLTGVDAGSYTLFLYVDYPTDTSESDETNNVVGIPLTVTAVDPLVTQDQDHETKQGVPLNASVFASALNPNSHSPLTFAVDNTPTYGGVTLDPATGAFTYSPDPEFVGIDTFAWTVTYCGVTSLPATVTITVLPACDWVFEGLKSPLNGVLYRAKRGSVVPLAWRYEEPNGASIDSGNAGPVINFKGWTGLSKCSDGLENPQIDFDLEEDPGSSDLRYSGDSWQFNWQSKYPDGYPNAGSPLPKGCYEITITLTEECVGKKDGPFQVYLR